MSSETIRIMFPRGGRIPALVLGLAADKVCQAMEPVEVPASYAEHLIHDRFAVEVPEKEKRATTKKA